MRTQTVIAMLAGVVLGASVEIAVRSRPMRGVSEAAPADKRQVAKIAAEWLRGHCQNVELSEPVDKGSGIMISGNVAYREGTFGSYGLEIDVDPSNETVVACCICPVAVAGDCMAAMREFAVRADFKMRDSIATLYLGADGRLRCRASMPFDALLVDPDEAMWLMVGSAGAKLSGCEKAAMRVCHGGCSPSAAVSEIGEAADVPGNCPCHREWVDVYKGLPPTEDVVKRWFDEEEGYYEMQHAGSHTKFSGVWRCEVGDGRFVAMGYEVEIGHQVLSSSCRNPINFLYENRRDDEMCEFMSGFNERNSNVAIIMDFDKGDMFFRHSMPISVLRLPRTKERLGRSLSDITGVICDAYWRTCEDIGIIIGAR